MAACGGAVVVTLGAGVAAAPAAGALGLPDPVVTTPVTTPVAVATAAPVVLPSVVPTVAVTTPVVAVPDPAPTASTPVTVVTAPSTTIPVVTVPAVDPASAVTGSTVSTPVSTGSVTTGAVGATGADTQSGTGTVDITVGGNADGSSIAEIALGGTGATTTGGSETASGTTTTATSDSASDAGSSSSAARSSGDAAPVAGVPAGAAGGASASAASATAVTVVNGAPASAATGSAADTAPTAPAPASATSAVPAAAASTDPIRLLSLAATPSTSAVYPVKDGYRDGVVFHVSGLSSTGAAVPVTGSAVLRRGAKIVAAWPLTSSVQDVTWDGREQGRILSAAYRLAVAVRDGAGTVRTAASAVTVSPKRLVATTSRVTAQAVSGHHAMAAAPRAGLERGRVTVRITTVASGVRGVQKLLFEKNGKTAPLRIRNGTHTTPPIVVPKSFTDFTIRHTWKKGTVKLKRLIYTYSYQALR